MDEKKIRWFTVSMIAFSMVWGFGNVVNNYAQQGISVVTSWILIMALYFIPYALIVGQLANLLLLKHACILKNVHSTDRW